MGFQGRSVVAAWSLAAGDKASCFQASRLIATASWAYGATVTAAAASAEAGLVATVSGARGEPVTTSRVRGVIAELFLAARLRELVPGVCAHKDNAQAHGDSCAPPRSRSSRQHPENGSRHDDIPKRGVGHIDL